MRILHAAAAALLPLLLLTGLPTAQAAPPTAPLVKVYPSTKDKPGVYTPKMARTGKPARFSFVFPAQLVQFTANYTISWGDGSTATGTLTPLDAYSDAARPLELVSRHVYTQPGRYTVKFTVADSTWSRKVRVNGSTSTPPPPAPPWQDTLLNRFTTMRDTAGVPPLTVCPLLDAVANDFITQIAATGHLATITPTGATPATLATASGYAGRVSHTVAAGSASPGDIAQTWESDASGRTIITLPGHTHVGLGRSGTGADTYWVAVFGTGAACPPVP